MPEPSPDALRATVARSTFGLAAAPLAPSRVGPVTLRPHQRVAVTRLRGALATHGGALLADAVGLGKTWVALAILDGTPAPVVVAPAALRRMWRDAADRAGLAVRVVTTESLGTRGAPPAAAGGPVVVDEAHHFRTPDTRRRRQLRALVAGAPLLLLSATPVHNRARDLTALLALFLGDSAATLDAATLAYLVVRRRHRDVAVQATTRPAGRPPAAADDASRLPRVAATRWRSLAADARVLDALLAVPPPLPPKDGGHAPALDTMTCVRLWASSDAALRAGLRRRLARACALAHALDDGRHLTRRDLVAWAGASGDPGAVQLGLALDSPLGVDARPLASSVEAHAAGVRHALAVLGATPPADPGRLAWLRDVRGRHPGARTVVFTQFAETARAVYRDLAADGRIGLLTAAGGRIASGPIARDALLARFAPLASGAPPPSPVERVDTLVATDCLSEGLDLRDASVVVHLDVPWTPARLAQRVGRAARLGSPVGVVHVYGLRPPRAASAWLRVARRLRAKAGAARRALGGSRARGRTRALARHLASARRLEAWLLAERAGASAPTGALPRRESPPTATDTAGAAALTGGVRCGRSGVVAVWHPGGRGPAVLLAAFDGRPLTSAPGRVARALRVLAQATRAATPDAAAIAAAERAVAAWTDQRRARLAVGHGARPALPDDRPPASPATGPAAPPAAPATTSRRRDPRAPRAGRAAARRAAEHAAWRAVPPHARAAHALAAQAADGAAPPAGTGAGAGLRALVLLLP